MLLLPAYKVQIREEGNIFILMYLNSPSYSFLDIMVDQNRLSAVLLQKNEGYGYLSKVTMKIFTSTI